MILEIINQMNIYAAEYRFLGLDQSIHESKAKEAVHADKWSKALSIQNTMISIDESDIAHYINAHIHDILHSSALNAVFSQEFQKIFASHTESLVKSGVAINYDNCYKKFIRPMLKQCKSGQMTEADLKNLLNEFDPQYAKLASDELNGISHAEKRTYSEMYCDEKDEDADSAITDMYSYVGTEYFDQETVVIGTNHVFQ